MADAVLAKRAILMVGEMVAASDGHLAVAEARSAELFGLLSAMGLPEAITYRATMGLAGRREQDRMAEMLPAWTEFRDSRPVVFDATDAAVMYMLASTGEVDEAARLLDRAAANRFTDVPDEAGWPMAIGLYAETAALVADRSVAAVLAEILEPFAATRLQMGTGGIMLGPAARLVALLVAVAGDDEACDRWFAAAIEDAGRLDSPIWNARSRLDWAERLLGRGEVAARPNSQTRPTLRSAISTSRRCAVSWPNSAAASTRTATRDRCRFCKARCMVAADGSLDRGTRLALVAMALGVFVVANDFTALSVAIPKIESDLDTTLSKAQWVINGYALVFGVLIVTGGRIADLFGRRRVFVIGATTFAAFSLLAGLMPTVGLLIVCRGLMGVGGALMWPAVLGMTYSLLPESKAGLAGGLILGVAGIGNAVGPLIGGLLTDELSWRWIFFVNVPVAAFAIWVTLRQVSESTVDSGTRHLDYTGVVILTAGIVAVLLALDEGPNRGFTDPLIVGLFACGAVALVAFGFVERREGEDALVPPSVLRNRVFRGSALTVLIMSAIFFAALLYVPQYMVKVLEFSALESGAGLLPMMGMFAVTSFTAGSLYGRLGPRVVLTAGVASLAAGMVLLSFVDADSSYGSLVPGLIVLGAGVGLFYSSITTLAVTALDPDRASLAGGIVYMGQIAGGAVGLGVNTAIVTSANTLVEGIRNAFIVDAVLALVGLVLIQTFVGSAPEAEPTRS